VEIVSVPSSRCSKIEHIKMERVSVPRAISEMKANTMTITCHCSNGKKYTMVIKITLPNKNTNTLKLLFAVVKVKTTQYIALCKSKK